MILINEMQISYFLQRPSCPLLTSLSCTLLTQRRPRRLTRFARPPDPLRSPSTAVDDTLPSMGLNPNISPLKGAAGVVAGVGGSVGVAGSVGVGGDSRKGSATGGIGGAAAAAAEASAAAAAAVKELLPQHRRVSAVDTLAPIREISAGSAARHRSNDALPKPIVSFSPSLLLSSTCLRALSPFNNTLASP